MYRRARTIEWSCRPALGPRASVPCAASKSSAPSRPRLHGVSVSGLGCYESFFLSVSQIIPLSTEVRLFDNKTFL